MPDERYENRRSRTLTDEDIELLSEKLQCAKCSFNNDEADTLRHLANNINTATKISTKIIITAMVMGFLGGIWFAIKHVVMDALATGKLPR